MPEPERPALIPGSEVTIVGTVKSPRRHPSRNGPFATATLLADDGREVRAIWWDADAAPAADWRVAVRGEVKLRDGAPQIHARRTERREGTRHPLASIARFYLGCVEAQAADELRLRIGEPSHILLAHGASPLHGARVLPASADSWCRDRQEAVGETIVAGWPLAAGFDAKGLAFSPLLVSDAELERSAAGGWICRCRSVNLNPYALDLLGVEREEREELVDLTAENPAVDEAASPERRAAAILETLRASGVAALGEAHPQALSRPAAEPGIHNAAALAASTGAAAASWMLIQDLAALANDPRLMERGPAAILAGISPVQPPPPLASHPSLLPSTLAQDQAVHAAMTNALTVVTGPPGTGKSQMIVNAVAAAVLRGESVLLASKNNHAVDVVVERLRQISPAAAVARAGAASRREELARTVRDVANARRRASEVWEPSEKWPETKKRVEEVHRHLRNRIQADRELDEARRALDSALPELPPGAPLDVDRDALAAAVADAARALGRFGGRLGIFWKRRRHAERLARARDALDRVSALMGGIATEDCLSSVDGRPIRTAQPRQDFRSVEELAGRLRDVSAVGRAATAAASRLAELPLPHQLEDRLRDLADDRAAAGRAVFEAHWKRIVPRKSADAAADLAAALDDLQKSGTGAGRARELIAKSLAAIPIWGVTNLSARTNLPLRQGLFDLVVVDEASQCDIASALPLLVRGKRALIIGDRRQLVHICSLGRARERIIGERCGLTADQLAEFSYRDRSCFDLAAGRAGRSSIFLDRHFRSHPAISGFANEFFYGRRMQLCAEARPPEGLSAIQWIRHPGDSRPGPRGRSRMNPEEAAAVESEVARDLPFLDETGLSVGVVTPYRAQVNEIAELLSKRGVGPDRVNVATAHGFQGDERDVIYFSPVVGPSTTERQAAFAADPNLVNVALTRARRRLVIVGNFDACAAYDNPLRDLARYVDHLESKMEDNPLRLALGEALLLRGVPTEAGRTVGSDPVDLAVIGDRVRLDVECAPFPPGGGSARDRRVEAAGWKVLRFDGRQLGHDLDGCVETILNALGA